MIAVPGFEGRRVAVFGLGRSGLSAARALRAGGAEPVLWDDTARGRDEAAREGFTLEDLTGADWRGQVHRAAQYRDVWLALAARRLARARRRLPASRRG